MHFRTVQITLVLLWLGSATVFAATPNSKAEHLIHADRVLVVAHRGDSLKCPENTLPAFASAVAAGSDLVELDYVHTSDGIPLVIHDGTLDRTTDARAVFDGKKIGVDSKPLDQLLKLDAGRWFAPQFAGTRLPTLEESLDVIQNGSTTLIERKAGDAKTCVELLRRKGLIRDVVVQSFDWNFLADCHELEPEIVLAALGFKPVTDADMAKIKKTGAAAVGWDSKYIDQDLIDRFHDAEYKVWAWTVDNSDRAQQLMELGINGIITNAPGRIKELIDQRPSTR